MNTIKHLITGGCSFSAFPLDNIITWPYYLADKLNLQNSTEFLSVAGGGNGIISKRIIHAVNNALKNFEAEKLLVGIVWAANTPTEFFDNNNKIPTPRQIIKKENNSFENPISVAGDKVWHLAHPAWYDNCSTEWYDKFHNETASYIKMIEDILRTQWFLKLHNVKYFMSYSVTTPIYSNFRNSQLMTYEQLKDNPDVSYLVDMIDIHNFLPVNSLYDWALNKSGLLWEADMWGHPLSAHHKLFVESIILPFLNNK